MSDALYDCRVAYAEAVEALAAEDTRVVVVLNDSVGSGMMAGFSRRWPERLFNVGIAEQDIVGIAAGLATAGCGRSSPRRRRSSPGGRSADQGGRRLLPCPGGPRGDEPGVAWRSAPPSAIEDLAWMRALANLTVLVPADPGDVRPSALRSPSRARCSCASPPAVPRPPRRLPVAGRRRFLPPPGGDVTLVACGTMVSRARGCGALAGWASRRGC